MATGRQLTGRERRIDDRFVVKKTATIHAYRMETLTTELVDISSGGGMLLAENSHFVIGDEVSMRTCKIEVVCTVAWVRDGFLGLSFHRRLTNWEVDAIRRSED